MATKVYIYVKLLCVGWSITREDADLNEITFPMRVNFMFYFAKSYLAKRGIILWRDFFLKPYNSRKWWLG